MKPLTVLNTRAREQASELSGLLCEAGFEAVEAAAIAIVPAWDVVELESVRQALARGAFDWVVLPSQNAGRELAADLAPSQARVLCGAATARALGLNAAVTLERFSAAAALDVLCSRVRPDQRVLVPRARKGRDELFDGLSELGVTVISPVAYETIGVDDAACRLAAGGIDVVSLCSPSAVSTVAPAVRDEMVVCLGGTTADAARAAGLHVAGVAHKTSMASLVDAIQALLGARV